MIVSFEGIEKCGKETQSKLLKSKLDKQGIAYFSGREPGGTSHGEAERRSLQDPQWIERINYAYQGKAPELRVGEDLVPPAEMFGYFKARAQFFALHIKPREDKNELLVLDRTGDSTVAYQGWGLYKGDPEVLELIMRNNAFAMAGVHIRRTWLMDIPVDEMLRRKDHGEFGSGKDRIEQRDTAYFERVRKGYLWLAERFPERYIVIDGTQPVEVIHDLILKDLETIK